MSGAAGYLQYTKLQSINLEEDETFNFYLKSCTSSQVRSEHRPPELAAQLDTSSIQNYNQSINLEKKTQNIFIYLRRNVLSSDQYIVELVNDLVLIVLKVDLGKVKVTLSSKDGSRVT